jgi:hypothetical protein
MKVVVGGKMLKKWSKPKTKSNQKDWLVFLIKNNRSLIKH